MDKVELLRTAGTAIVTNKTRSVLTTLGIIIGVAAVIMLVAIGNGLKAYVTRQFEDLGANVLLVAPGKINIRGGPGRPVIAAAKFTFEDVREIGKLGGPILDASPTIFKAATARWKNKTSDVSLNGVDEKYGEIRNIKADEGQFITRSMVERSQTVVVIGPKVASDLGVGVGDEIEVSNRKLTVVGITVTKGAAGFGSNSDQDAFVYVPVSTAIKITGEKNPGSVVVRAVSPEEVGAAARRVREYFARRRLTEDDYTVLEPKEILATITSFLGVVTTALSGIAAISLVVGGIGIANIMLVSVTERTREIGLRKAMGATKRDIMLQFLIEAVVLSALGGMIGIGIGGGFSLVLRRFIQTEVTAESVVLAFGVSAAVGVISGLAPAMRAARLDPIAALRYE